MQELALIMAAGGVDPDEAEFVRLVKLAKGGDSGAFEVIVLRHERRVLSIAMHLLGGNREDARDAAQQVFLRLHRHLDRVNENLAFAGWLYRVTVNVCRDIHRARAARPTVPLEQAGDVAGASESDEALIRGEQSRIIHAALATLSEKERAAVVLRDLEGLSTREVARILGSSEGTVRSQISHARLKMRQHFRRSS
jgi:RNA polymerase sigma-70 factor (ECF subfamily)